MIKRIWFIAILFILIFAGKAEAGVWTYKINSSETVIDTSKTSAVVDTTLHEIRLPRSSPKVVGFEGENFDYLALTPTEVKRFSWDGSTLVENTVIRVPGLSNPVAVLPSFYPDVAVATSSVVTHYALSGGTMSPVWSVSGFTSVMSIGTREMDFAALDGSVVKYYGYNGSGGSYISNLSITSGLVNPLDVALSPNTYDCVVLQSDKARYYAWTGSSLTEVLGLNITNLSAPKSISMGTENNIAIVDGSQVKLYVLSGGSFVNIASITSGLSNPISVALRPGSNDLIVADGDNVKYYMFDGSGLVYNDNLSKAVSGLSNIGSYAPSAVAVSNVNVNANNITKARIRAYCSLPNSTSIEFYMSTDGGSTWGNAVRVSRNSSGVVTVELGNGSSWVSSSLTLNDINPQSTVIDLWRTFNSGKNIAWKAVLITSNSSNTPKIVAPNPGVDNAIVWDTNSPPNNPTVNVPGGGVCFYVPNPTITWTFSDPDSGDYQTAYELEIRDTSGVNTYIATGQVIYGGNSYTLSNSSMVTLYNTGNYAFKVYIRVRDSAGEWSNFSNPSFCIQAFFNPVIQTIISRPSSDTTPLPFTINKDMVFNDLPKTKAGGKVVVTVNAMGISIPPFAVLRGHYYVNTDISVNPISSVSSIGDNYTYEISFWTSADPTKFPSGEYIVMSLVGNFSKSYLYLDKSNIYSNSYWAEGVVGIEGTVWSDWFVILQGRN